jgi:hypothetical protein
MIDTDYGINNKAICDNPTKLMHITAFCTLIKIKNITY